MTDPMELVVRLEAVEEVSDLHGGPAYALRGLIDEAAACIREMVEWRPIETAPRDGTVFVAISISKWGERYDSQTFKPFGCWRSKEGWAREVHGFRTFGNHVAHPTHWLPLHPVPGAEA